MALRDPMLLTLSSPARQDFDFKTPHDFAAYRTSGPKQLTSPPPERSAAYHSRTASVTGSGSTMSGPPHRLPPPAPSLSLPDPSRLPHPPSAQSSAGLPAPTLSSHQPSVLQWPQAGPDHPATPNYYASRIEEERTKQEEERTRQDSLLLERRKIEQNMLIEALRSGVSANLVPLIFMGISHGKLPPVATELLQIVLPPLLQQQQQRQQQQLQQLQDQQQPYAAQQSPESARSHGPPGQQPGYQGQGIPLGPQTPLAPGGQYAPYPSGPGSGSRGGGTLSGPPSSQRTQFSASAGLPRIITEPLQGFLVPGGQQAGAQQHLQEQQQSPGISFQMWHPPSTQAGSGGVTAAATPSDHSSSPKKRKSTGPHQPAPVPLTRFAETSSTPSATSASRRSQHARQRSDLSSIAGRGRVDSPVVTPTVTAVGMAATAAAAALERRSGTPGPAGAATAGEQQSQQPQHRRESVGQQQSQPSQPSQPPQPSQSHQQQHQNLPPQQQYQHLQQHPQQPHSQQQHAHQQAPAPPAQLRAGIVKPEDTAGTDRDSGGDYSGRQSSQQVGGPVPNEDVEMQER